MTALFSFYISDKITKSKPVWDTALYNDDSIKKLLVCIDQALEIQKVTAKDTL
jgi:hypothetical protein